MIDAQLKILWLNYGNSTQQVPEMGIELESLWLYIAKVLESL